MSITKLKLITTAEHDAQRLDEALADFLTEKLKRSVSKAKVRKLIMAGAIYLEGRRTRIPSQGLHPGAEIQVHVDISKIFDDATSRDRPFEVTPERILFEDEDLIAIDKPAGLPAQPTLDKSRYNLFEAVGRFLTRRDGIAKPYIGVHQRLDRDTSGVVLFTKSRRVNAPVGDIFSKHLGTKIYQALTIVPAGDLRIKLKREWTIKNCLGKVISRSKRAGYGAVRTGGEFAETAFRLIAEYSRGLWIEAIPKTGRTHQIRVHLSEYGLPILGDDLYDEKNSPEFSRLATRLMLHASQLIFPHPITKREISVQSPLPEDFQQCLLRIEASPNKPLRT